MSGARKAAEEIWERESSLFGALYYKSKWTDEASSIIARHCPDRTAELAKALSVLEELVLFKPTRELDMQRCQGRARALLAKVRGGEGEG